ncbi:unnamed protein product, partial [Musa banksii]
AYNLNPQRFLNEVLNAVDDMVDGAFDFCLHFRLRLVLFPFYFPFCPMCIFHLRHRSFVCFLPGKHHKSLPLAPIGLRSWPR